MSGLTPHIHDSGHEACVLVLHAPRQHETCNHKHCQGNFLEKADSCRINVFEESSLDKSDAAWVALCLLKLFLFAREFVLFSLKFVFVDVRPMRLVKQNLV
jgi:hypothetical protein